MMCLVTVPHTATYWMKLALGLDTFTHAANHRVAPARLRDADIIVSPLRHPKSVWHTFAKYDGEDEQWFWDNWYALAEFDKQYPIHYIPIDCLEIRDELFSQISDRTPDWAVKENSSNRAVCAEYIDLTPIWEMLPVVERFYGT